MQIGSLRVQYGQVFFYHLSLFEKYLDEVSNDAKIMGAVNTVYWKDGKLFGENVDGKGFMMSLKKGNVSVKDKKIVERRDQVLMTCLLPEAFISSIFFKRLLSANGPFFNDLAMVSILLI